MFVNYSIGHLGRLMLGAPTLSGLSCSDCVWLIPGTEHGNT